MTGERGTRRKSWVWLALVWLGALLMLGALALPARAIAGGVTAPTTPATSGLDAATQVHTALTAQGYVVTHVGLHQDGGMAGVIMRPASHTFDDALWQQVQAGWQALAAAYPQATWLLSAYTQGDRYLVCFLVPAGSTPAAGQMGLYDTLLGRWVQEKDFARKDFGALARASVSLTPIPTASLPAAETGPDRLQDASADYRFLPAQDRVPETVTMRPEDRRRWLAEPLNAAAGCWRAAPAPTSPVTAVTPDQLRQRPASAPRGEARPAARWTPRVYPAGAESRDAGEDPADDPPPTTSPLLVPQPTSKKTLLPQAFAFLLVCPDPPARLGLDDDTIPLIPQPLLAWPTLRVRPPPRVCAPR